MTPLTMSEASPGSRDRLCPWQWTRKIDGKTVTRLVADDQLDDYRQWLDNHRRLRALVAELEAMTLAFADADPRAKRRPAPARHTSA